MSSAANSPQVPVLRQPSEPVRPVVADAPAMGRALASLSQGTGPVAIDVERAGGYRYTQRAYLLQLRRAQAGTWMIDPLSVELRDLAEVLADPQWVLHAASQDLPSLYDLGLRPSSVFDTELAGRLLGMPRVGLAAMTEELLGYTLAKAHSAADWSRRPLPESWLSYAALDVEPLLDLRATLIEKLRSSQRLEWAEQEFEAVRNARPPADPSEPWRRVKRLTARTPRALGITRELWTARDLLARQRDLAPGRVLKDAAIAACAAKPPTSAAQLRTMPEMTGQPPEQLDLWWSAISRAAQLPEDALPLRHPGGSGVPQARAWAKINPVAATRLQQVRAQLNDVAQALPVAVEHLITPRVLREMVWQASGGATQEEAEAWDPATVVEQLRLAGVRPWQQELVTPVLTDVLGQVSAPSTDE